MNDIITLDEITPLTLPDGEQLDARQSLAITLRATSTLNIDEIAKKCGYAGRSTCSHFLRSDRGKAGVQVAIRQHLLDGARVGLQTMVNLATSARSENVRQLAATGNRDVNISINLNSADTGIVIDGQKLVEEETDIQGES